MLIAKHGLSTLLSTNYYFTDLLTGGLLDKEPEQKLVWLCGGILSNIALHPNNRSDSIPCRALQFMCLIKYHMIHRHCMCPGYSIHIIVNVAHLSDCFVATATKGAITH